MLKDRKLLILPTPPLFDAAAQGEPLRISGWKLPAKTRGMGLPYGENLIIVTSTVFLWYNGHQSDRQTDEQTDGRAGDSI